ncbi:MAG TPA: hypothetical protein VE715_15790 [Blastocatellia bacterium]|nr:hypothetical protein [Blastocatellia bacterium]
MEVPGIWLLTIPPTIGMLLATPLTTFTTLPITSNGFQPIPTGLPSPS